MYIQSVGPNVICMIKLETKKYIVTLRNVQSVGVLIVGQLPVNPTKVKLKKKVYYVVTNKNLYTVPHMYFIFTLCHLIDPVQTIDNGFTEGFFNIDKLRSLSQGDKLKLEKKETYTK